MCLVAMLSQHGFSRGLHRHTCCRNAHWCNSTNSLKTTGSKAGSKVEFSSHFTPLWSKKGFLGEKEGRDVNKQAKVSELYFIENSAVTSDNLCPQEHLKLEANHHYHSYTVKRHSSHMRSWAIYNLHKHTGALSLRLWLQLLSSTSGSMIYAVHPGSKS